MKINLDSRGLFVVFRCGSPGRDAVGFKIKPKRHRLFSERHGLKRGFCFGPLWFGTYANRGTD